MWCRVATLEPTLQERLVTLADKLDEPANRVLALEDLGLCATGLSRGFQQHLVTQTERLDDPADRTSALRSLGVDVAGFPANSSSTRRGRARFVSTPIGTSPQKTCCLPDPAVGPNTGLSSRPWSRQQSLTMSIRLPDSDVLIKVTGGCPNHDIAQFLPCAYRAQALKAAD
ncbi:hypothetical protein ABIB90_008128 [Bradyrhizobium sp. JR4.1]